MRSFSQLFDDVSQDLKYALRGLRKSPGFAAAVIVTLALGIGANAAMFGVVDRLMFRPYPYLRDPSTVHRIYLRQTERGTTRTQANGIQYTRYMDIKNGTASFTHHAAFLSPSLAVGVGDAARERRVGVVSAAFWDFFAARPALGRFFTGAEDTTPRGADVVVLGHGFWKAAFGGRADVLGQTLQVNNVTATIIGVAPEGFVGFDDNDPPALFMPITTYRGRRAEAEPNDPTSWFTTYNTGLVSIMVRRKPGVSVEQANADVTQAYRASYLKQMELSPAMTPLDKANPTGIVSAMKVGAGPDPSLEARTALWVTGVAAIVLLIACANVANLFLARALKRQREIAVRLALGVTRARLLMQTLTESMVLSLLGSAAGLLVAYWGGAGIRRLLVASQNAPLEVFTDWRTIGVAIGAALLAGLLTGIAPSFVSVRGDLAKTLKTGARGGSYQRSRARNALLVLQGALSVVLLVGAGLFVKSLDNVKAMRIGYDAEPVLLANRSMRGMRLDSAASVALRTALVERARAIPGVEAAAWIYSVPFRSTSATRLFVAGIDTVARLGRFTYQASSSDYFETMGTRIVRGRSYTDADRAGAPRVMVVSESMGRVLWPNADPLGQCVRVGADTMPCTTVIGIAEDMVQNDLQASTRFHYYMPVEQFDPAGGNGLFLKMRGDPRQQQEAVRKALQTVMPGQTFVTVMPLIEIVDGARRSWQLGATMFVAFGVLALLVAAIGLYGVIGYNVTQRMHELGVRVALGAQSKDILRLVVGQGMAFAFAGVVLGGVIAFVASRWMQPLLFQQSAKDPVVYALVGAIMLVVALAASASPAARAAKADPNAALRAE
jgi:putative ABC transport system permease protein